MRLLCDGTNVAEGNLTLRVERGGRRGRQRSTRGDVSF